MPVRSKQLSFGSPENPPLILRTLLLSLLLTAPLQPARGESAEDPHRPRFLGTASCTTSGCHGGAGRNQNQYLVWSSHDFHSLRPYATLTTARSRQIALALSISNPVLATECTSCHAPWHQVPASLAAGEIKALEGISCENCHGPAESWVRSHTRPDWTHTDRVQAGMRDLRNLYGRANTCIACHQTIESSLERAGHPELIFELDGQAVSQPKHWREQTNWNGGQAWLVGQAAALREMSWQLSLEPNPGERLLDRWQGLLWVLQKTGNLDPAVAGLDSIPLEPSPANLARARDQADALAKTAATLSWTPVLSGRILTRLAGSGADFREAAPPRAVQARRAERLVLGLERLALSATDLRPGTPPDHALEQLFKLVQSLPDFDPATFAQTLEQFSSTLGTLPLN